jgi:23S rRNA (pseudouridine1915-N3)-methyltransferase
LQFSNNQAISGKSVSTKLTEYPKGQGPEDGICLILKTLLLNYDASQNLISLKLSLIQVGKTEEAWLREGIETYISRLKHYTSFSSIEIPALKNTKTLSPEQQNEKEGELILKAAEGADRIYLLDEGGKMYSSPELAQFIQKQMNGSVKHLVFVIGGPYGFSETVQKRATGKISLSMMTFTHQMVRLFYTEQLYRAFTILKGEKYHHF